MQNCIIAGTIRADVALQKGMELLLQGKSALDVVEETIRVVEDNLGDWTVGSGGLPNLLGEVELDASIMDGKSLKAGAVAGIKKFKNPISIARKIMEATPHILLVGEGADKFAELSGFEKTNLLSKNAAELHRDFIEGKGLIRKEYDTDETFKTKERYAKSFKHLVENDDLMGWYAKYAKKNHGTVNVLVKDMSGDLCAGVSTSGLSFKLPGRTGDSALIGSGNYADNRYGSAACVGIGEIAIRLSLARIAVYELSKGMTCEEAAISAIKSIAELGEDVGSLAILVMDQEGNVASATNIENFYYWVADSLNPIPTKKECINVDIKDIEKQGLGYHR